MEKQEYISREDYISQRLTGSIYDSKDKLQTEWYNTVIQSSAGNKLRLLEDNSELAYQMFARYDDEEGFELIIARQASDDETKRNAKVQLESLLSVLRPQKTSEIQEPLVGPPRSKMEIYERGDVIHRGRSQVKADIEYHGSGSLIEQPSA